MPAPLPPQIEPEPQPGDDLFAPEIMAEITNQEQKHGIYTADRFERHRPEQAKACLKWLSAGMPVQEIARSLNVSDRTVVAMADKHADEITDLEKHFAKKCRRAAHYLVERVERNPGIVPAQSIGPTVKSLFETAQLADGRPTEIIEEVKRIDIYAHWKRFVAGDEIGLSGGKIPIRDAELVDPAPVTAGELGDALADQAAALESGLQSDVLGPSTQGETGLATLPATPSGPNRAPIEAADHHADEPAASSRADGRGGGRDAAAQPNPTMDNGSQKFYRHEV